MAASADHAAVVERHVVQMQALVFDLGIAYGTCVGPSWNKQSRFGCLVPLSLVFESGIERIDLGEEIGEAGCAARFAL